MTGVSFEENFDVSAEKFYAALVDYKSYAEILTEVDDIKVLECNESSARIQYSINVIKSFSYILKMTHKRPSFLSWELESGSIFKKNSGHWRLDSLGPNSCKIYYNLEVELKVFAPKIIINKLVAVNLPRMMQTFYARSKAL